MEQTEGRKRLTEVINQKDVFLRIALSPLLFVIVMMPLNHIIRNCRSGYKLHTSQEKFNQLLFVDSIKRLAKNENELETMIPAVWIPRQDIGMEFFIEKYAMQIMRSVKRQMTEGIELTNQGKIRTFREKGNLQVFRNIWSGPHQISVD